MRHFHRLCEGLPVAALAHALARQPGLWNQNTFRTTYPNTPFADVDDIWLRFSDPEKCQTETRAIGEYDSVWWAAATALPEAKPLILDLMRAVGAWELGRVVLSRVKPGAQVLPHADNSGPYVLTPDGARYHLVVQGLPGSLYHCGDETVNMRTGDAWWFNHQQVHAVVNNSADDRIHLMVDVRLWP